MPKFHSVIGLDMAYRKPVQIAQLLAFEGHLITLHEVQPRSDVYGLATDCVTAIHNLTHGLAGSKPTLVVCETPLLINNRNTAYVLTRLHAMLEYGVRGELGQYFFGIHPNTWQAAMLGKVKDRKAKSIEVAEKIAGICGLSNDEADAVNMAKFCIKHMAEIQDALRGKGKFSEKVRKPD